MKNLARLLLALAPFTAHATPLDADAAELRERLQPFGTVCRTADACPSATAADAANWQVTAMLDQHGAETGRQGMQSPWASSAIRWPQTSAALSIAADASATLRFTNPALAGGERSRYGRWENHWVTLAVGEREKAFYAKRPVGQDLLLLGSGPTAFLTRALAENAGDTLTVRMRYQGAGDVEFGLPLAGARQAMGSVGFIEVSADELAADQTVTAEPQAAAPSIAAMSASGNRSGQQIYAMFCFACHATGVSEAPLFGSLEQWQPRIDKGMDELVATSVTGFDLMPPQGTCMNCTEQEMRATIQYMIDSTH